ncbi:hypothetical protein JV173_02775 [Acholeplasma equirhinis]|uniref:S26 family signal peptidase n=1 Tax=Acholeplasma equirhinis TaxID=555393 RepID=UPI00197AE698|nr:S26 family signal peptidase [Acholeplasma equirhinis]MBN3490433.1 hypothetical protein [Acholeplasma equirhinis]
MLYKIADLIVKMNPQYDPLTFQATQYLVSGDFDVDIDIPDLSEHVQKYQHENNHLTLGEAEYMIYGSYFYTKLIKFNGFFLHSSAVVYQDKAYLFSAPSGTGKSTHAALWATNLNAYILNDDKPAIRLINDKFIVYGTPFTGKTNTGVNKKVELGNIIFLERSLENYIHQISNEQSLKFFLRETIRPFKEENMELVLNLYQKLATKHPFYLLGCNVSIDALYTALHGLNLISSIEKTLLTKGFVVTNVYGRSMLPLLRENIDQVLIKKTDTYHIYDVVLFKSNDKLVLHRIIKIKGDTYYITGDNQYKLEHVYKNQIKGKMKAFYKEGKEIPVNDTEYLKYVKRITRTRLLRAIIRKLSKKKGNHQI